MQPLIDQLTVTFGEYVLNIGAAVLILIVGWLLALLIATLVRKGLEAISFDNRIAEGMGFDRSRVNIERLISNIVFWVLMLVVVAAILQALELTLITQPFVALLNTIFSYVPNLLAAGGLLLLAWILASAARFLIIKLFSLTRLDNRLADHADVAVEGQPPLSKALADIVYWFILLLFLPGVVAALNITGLLLPVQSMVAIILSYVPNFIAAALILVLGWLVARIIRQVVTNFLAAIGTDRLGERIGLRPAASQPSVSGVEPATGQPSVPAVRSVTGQQTLSKMIGTAIYVLILIPVVISALQALQIQAISVPATNMLNTLLSAIPAIFGAIVILAIAYFVARLVSDLVVTLLTSIGFNRVLGLIGLGGGTEVGQWTPAEVVGYLVLIGIMLFAAVEAAGMLGFTSVAILVTGFLFFAGQIILGIVILGIGLYLADVARRAVLGLAGSQAVLLSRAAYAAVVVLAVFMGLRQMGVADDIVNLAFGLLLGAVAVAVALAFGLGSREIAGREVEALLTRIRTRREPTPRIAHSDQSTPVAR